MKFKWMKCNGMGIMIRSGRRDMYLLHWRTSGHMSDTLLYYKGKNKIGRKRKKGEREKGKVMLQFLTCFKKKKKEFHSGLLSVSAS